MAITGLYFSLPENHPLFAEIGRVASAWAHFESELDQAIIEMSGAEERFGLCVLTQFIGSAPRIRAIMALCHAHSVEDKDIVQALKKFMQSNYAVAESRNRIVHDPWILDAVAQVAMRHETVSRKSDSKVMNSLVPQTRDDIVEVNKAIDRHVLKFRMIYDKIKKRHPTAIRQFSPATRSPKRNIDPSNPNGGSGVQVRVLSREEVRGALMMAKAAKEQKQRGE